MPGPRHISLEAAEPDEALRWIVRFHAGDATEEDRQAFRTWIELEAHRREYERASTLWNDLDELKRYSFPALAEAQTYWRSKAPHGSSRKSRYQWGKISIFAALTVCAASIAVGQWWRM
jgi:ferric-dicitrate binding protein FerR (iron transport regulator)